MVDHAAEPIKKARGRPRKNPPPDPNKPKGKKGRPRKDLAINAANKDSPLQIYYLMGPLPAGYRRATAQETLEAKNATYWGERTIQKKAIEAFNKDKNKGDRSLWTLKQWEAKMNDYIKNKIIQRGGIKREEKELYYAKKEKNQEDIKLYENNIKTRNENVKLYDKGIEILIKSAASHGVILNTGGQAKKA